MFEQALLDYLKLKMPAAGELAISEMKRISGGSSRETYSFDLSWRENGQPRSRGMILRRDPTGGLLQSERKHEFGVIEAMFRAGLKVPEPLFLELGSKALDRPFLIMERSPGRTSRGAFPPEEPLALRTKIAGEFLGELAGLQALDYRKLGLEWLGAPQDLAQPAREQARHWREIYERDRMGEHYPILEAAFAWLEANPVKADRITLVHGDFRSGNYLYDERGLIVMLDWEMCHLGDPMEDLGWASMNFWGREELAGGLLEREAFYQLYQSKTGRPIDRKGLFFYQMLGDAKMAVICLTGIRAFAEGKTSDAVMPFLQFLLAPLFEDLANQLRLT